MFRHRAASHILNRHTVPYCAKQQVHIDAPLRCATNLLEKRVASAIHPGPVCQALDQLINPDPIVTPSPYHVLFIWCLPTSRPRVLGHIKI